MNSPIKIQELKNVVNYEVDYFICSASYEERCLVIPKQLSECKVKNVAIFCNKDFMSLYNGNEKIIESFFQNIPSTLYYLNTKTPAPNAIEILSLFDGIEEIEKKKFFIDTTTFTHESLLVLYKVLTLKAIPNENVLYSYINASEYSTNEIELDKKWLSKGIGEIRNVIGFGGFMNPLKKNHLIVLVGIELERTQSLIDKIEPNSLSLGVSYDHCSKSPAAIELNKKKHKTLCDKYFDSESFEFTVLSPKLVKDKLAEITVKHNDCNIIIAAMNNKISTIGAGSFAKENPEVQISYATALQYNIEGYTIPGDDCYLFSL